MPVVFTAGAVAGHRDRKEDLSLQNGGPLGRHLEIDGNWNCQS